MLINGLHVVVTLCMALGPVDFTLLVITSKNFALFSFLQLYPIMAKSIHGTKPEKLVPKIVRTKIRVMSYWKEHPLAFALTHMDEVVEELLTSEYWCDIFLPRNKKRETMWSAGCLVCWNLGKVLWRTKAWRRRGC
ncbi:putative pre-mRNA-splicing factor 38 [Rosa chinensis]|uniref:Pre-mRNA-splicing factor 38 n=1 Tax=Rosa chinensis TaxID=74649 RepID=A0A2P6P9Z5_ROSCH|nr:putative pre-mRNA-splicing factor 38 [Rosa chinensis]